MPIKSLHIRPFAPDDFDALTMLISRAVTADTGTPTVPNRQYVERVAASPDLTCLVAEIKGNLIGYCAGRLHLESGELTGEGCVHPKCRRQGIGKQLLQHLETTIQQQIAQNIVSLRTASDNIKIGSQALLTASGYTHLYTNTTMHRFLVLGDVPPALPSGLTLRPFVPDRDAHAVYSFHQQTFRAAQKHSDIPYDEWKTAFLEQPYFDPGLWLVLTAGETMVGISLSFPAMEGLGNVAVVAVDEGWRGRGLGRWLLLTSFTRLRALNFQRVCLIVDADNRPDALHLYESVGMQPLSRRHIYSKILTPLST